MNELTYFIMMVGIPASGKTTKAHKIAKELDGIVISSDELRKELFEDVTCQDRNTELFQEAHRRIIKLLKIGERVVFDATNLSSKRRKSLVQQLPREVFKACVYCSISVDESIKRDINRNRTVGLDVIDRMYKRVQTPMYKENWDAIILYPLHHRNDNKKEFILPKTYDEYESFLRENNCKDIIGLAQDTPYHTLSVSRHMYYAYDSVKDDDTVSEDVKIALLLHDIGKGYCKEFNGKYASFKGHECVSSQMAIEVLKNYNLDEKRIIRIATLIQLHMRLHDKQWGSKSRDRFRKEVGEDIWQDLLIMNNCDSTAK